MIWKCPKCGHMTVARTKKMAKSRHAMKSCYRTVPMRRKSTPIKAMIKIEEICMLYENSPKDGLSIISDLVESTLEGNR